MINKDTTICCSFSQNPTNKGCEYFNTLFAEHQINWIYKAFKVENIRDAVKAMKTLGFRGAGISMPFKTECLHAVDEMSEEVKTIWAANTIVNDNGKLTAYNTDWFAAHDLLGMQPVRPDEVIIFGTGGFAKAVAYACKQRHLPYQMWSRNQFEDLFNLRNTCVFNCTPVTDLHLRIDKSNTFLDCIIGTKTGNYLAERQARMQFLLYIKGFKYDYQKEKTHEVS